MQIIAPTKLFIKTLKNLNNLLNTKQSSIMLSRTQQNSFKQEIQKAIFDSQSPKIIITTCLQLDIEQIYSIIGPINVIQAEELVLTIDQILYNLLPKSDNKLDHDNQISAIEKEIMGKQQQIAVLKAEKLRLQITNSNQ